VGVRRRVPRPSGFQPDGQHFLASSRLVAELVEQAGVDGHDLVVEIGAGSGILTHALAARARQVIAVELDPVFVEHLRWEFASRRNVEVVSANALHVQLPSEPFRVFGNLPFSFGTRILRRLLDDVGSPLRRLDALVQFEAARKRASVAPGTLVSMGWLPWWEFSLVRRVPRSAFRPVPGADAGMLAVRRQGRPPLPPPLRPSFVRVLDRGFAASERPVRRTFPEVGGRNWSAFARDRGVDPEARPSDLDVFDWVALFELLRHGRRGRTRRGD
jgi:23S rRNA (adenine-N6)-dimethyltransferase